MNRTRGSWTTVGKGIWGHMISCLLRRTRQVLEFGNLILINQICPLLSISILECMYFVSCLTSFFTAPYNSAPPPQFTLHRYFKKLFQHLSPTQKQKLVYSAVRQGEREDNMPSYETNGALKMIGVTYGLEISTFLTAYL